MYLDTSEAHIYMVCIEILLGGGWEGTSSVLKILKDLLSSIQVYSIVDTTSSGDKKPFRWMHLLGLEWNTPAGGDLGLRFEGIAASQVVFI